MSVLSAAALVAASCGRPPDLVSDLAGDTDANLTILCSSNQDLCEAVTNAFEDDTGIQTEYVRVSTGEGVARLRAEAGHSTFDVWFGGPSIGPSRAALDGNIEPYISPNAANIPEELRAKDGTWTGIYLGALGFCSNVEYLNEIGIPVPESYADLLRPELRDNVTMADQRTSGTAATAGANIVAITGSQAAALAYLAELDANISRYTRSGATAGHLVAMGEAAVAVVFAHDCLRLQITTGVDLRTTFPSEGTAYEIGQVSLVAESQSPTAAKEFVDWALTTRAQEIAASVDVFSVPTNPDAVVPALAVSFDDLVIAEGFSPQMAEELNAGGFAERFGDEIRDGRDSGN